MSREVLIPVAFVAVVVLRLTMMLVFVPKRRRDGVRSSGAAPLAPAADREPKERSARARASAAAKNASDSSRRQVEPCTVVLGYDGHIGRTRIRTRDRGGRQRGRVVVVTARLHTEGDPWEQEFDAPLIQEPARLLDDAAILLQSHDVTVSTRAGGGDPAEAALE